MQESLGRRCTLVLLVAMVLALVTGLLAWGPIPLTAADLRHAGTRGRPGLPHVLNVLAALPQVLVGAWGWRITRSCTWPLALRRPWSAFHACTLLAGLLAMLYHAQPGRIGWIAGHTALCAAIATLGAGALAERVDARFGRVPTVALLLGCVLLAGLVVMAGDGADLRPLMLFEFAPALLLPAGAIALPGTVTRGADWLLMLLGFGLARLAHTYDAGLLAATGWISGHAAMHLLLAGVSGWLGYCALRSADGMELDSQRQASLNTAG